MDLMELHKLDSRPIFINAVWVVSLSSDGENTLILTSNEMIYVKEDLQYVVNEVNYRLNSM